MYEYGHGGNAVYEYGNEQITDLSASINPLGMPENVRDAIIGEISNCRRYPDNLSGRLRDKLAEYENVDPGYIFCGNGASDIISRLPGAIQARKVLVTAPTFSDYERSAGSYGSAVIRHELRPSNGFNLDRGVLDTVLHTSPHAVYICNPNNPTGVLTNAELLHELLDCCRRVGAVAVVDECFLDFAENAGDMTCKVFIDSYPNLVIIKAFTKLFALPGIRLGYAICPDGGIIDGLRANGADWPVSNLAQAAGMAALDDAENYVGETVRYVRAERKKLEGALERLGYMVFESRANFIFFRSPFPADLNRELGKRMIRIRSCGNFHGLDGSYYRAAVSTEENNAGFISALEDIAKANLYPLPVIGGNTFRE